MLREENLAELCKLKKQKIKACPHLCHMSLLAWGYKPTSQKLEHSKIRRKYRHRAMSV